MENDMMTGYLAGKSDANNGCCMPMMGGYGGGWGGYGGMWAEWIPLILIFGLLGWGGGGFGFGGGGGGNAGAYLGAEVQRGFDTRTVVSKLDGITNGLCDSTFALNNSIMGGFHGVDNAICTLGYQTQQGINTLAAQMAQNTCGIERSIDRNTTQGVMNTNAIQQQISACCCDLEKTNLQNRFDAAQANCNTLQAIDKLGDRILGYMANKETQDLRDEVQAYRLQASQERQNQYLVNQLRPCPVPAYITCNPFAASYGVGYGLNGGCGCAA